MKSEIRNPKSEIERFRPEGETGGDDFWTWGDLADQPAGALHEQPTSAPPPPPNLMERVSLFGEAIIRFVKKIPRGLNHPENNRIIDQLVGAGTSVGANYCEADDSISTKDFKFKIGTCRKESKESMFFLRMAATSEPGLLEEARGHWREAKQLNRIFGSMWRK